MKEEELLNVLACASLMLQLTVHVELERLKLRSVWFLLC